MRQKTLLTKLMLLVAVVLMGAGSTWAVEVTDVLDNAFIGVTGTTYSTWSGKVGSGGGAVYAGQSAGGNSAIQLRSNNNNSGIVTTASDGTCKKIVVTWNSNTISGRTLNVYGKNTAYSQATDLYNSSSQGTLIGTIVCGTSTELEIADSYSFIGFRSNSGAMYLDKVEITWEIGEASHAVATTTTVDASGITNTDVYTGTSAGTLTASVTETASGDAVSGATVRWSGNNDAVATIDATTGAVTLVAAGTVTFTATYAGVTDVYESSTGTYKLTVTDSTPFTGGDVTFEAGKDGEYNEKTCTKKCVTFTISSGAIANTEYRIYKSGTFTISTSQGKIKNIDFICSSGYAASNFTSISGFTTSGDNGTWTGEAESVSLVAGTAQVRVTKLIVTVEIDNRTEIATINSISPTRIGFEATGEFTFDVTYAEGKSESDATIQWKTNQETSSILNNNGGKYITGTTAGAATITVTVTPNDMENYKPVSKDFSVIVYNDQLAIAPTLPDDQTFLESMEVTITSDEEGAEFFYTLDGTEPTRATGTPYTGPFTITETTTVKAIATVGTKKTSEVVTRTYTATPIYANIASFKAANTTGYMRVDGAQVVFIDNDKKNIYVRDNSGAILIYKSGGFTTDLKTGDKLSGLLQGTYSPYYGLPEITYADISRITVTGNEAVVAKEIEGTTNSIAQNLNDLVKIVNTTITKNGSDFFVGSGSDIKLYDNFGVNYIAEDNKSVDVQGIAAIYEKTNITTYELFPRFKEDIVYLDNCTSASVGNLGMSTFSNTSAVDFTGVDAIEAYWAEVTTEGKITFHRIYKVPANTGLLLRNTTGNEAAVAAINISTLANNDANLENVTNNALVAVDTDIAALATDGENCTNYILNKVEGNIGFFRANGKKVAAGKAYLQVPASLSRSSFTISFDNETTTGISTMLTISDNVNNGIYDLQGRRVAQPAKGLYIVNGKKIIIR